jgi:hypothetical protein
MMFLLYVSYPSLPLVDLVTLDLFDGLTFFGYRG